MNFFDNSQNFNVKNFKTWMAGSSDAKKSSKEFVEKKNKLNYFHEKTHVQKVP